MKKKQIIIISIMLMAVIAIALLLIFTSSDKEPGYEADFVYESYTPEFMDAQEKSSFNLPEDSKIQVLKRDESGQVDVYKIIREDIDVEYNIEALRQPLR